MGAGLALVVIFAGGMAMLMAASGYSPAPTGIAACIVGYLVARSIWERLP